jgi:hypothetical protein
VILLLGAILAIVWIVAIGLLLRAHAWSELDAEGAASSRPAPSH